MNVIGQESENIFYPSSIIDFFESLLENESGYDLLNPLDKTGRFQISVKIIEHLLNELNAGKTDAILQEPQKYDSLPFIETKAGGVIYRNYGMVHGQPQKIDPILCLSESIKKSIEDIMNGYEKPESGRNFFCEQNLSFIFGIKAEHEINDISYFYNRCGNREKTRLKATLKESLMKNSLSETSETSETSDISDIIENSGFAWKKNRSNMEKFCNIQNLARSNMYYQGKAGEIILAQSLPEPINLEFEYMFEKAFNGKDHPVHLGVPIRSRFTARRLLEIGKSGKYTNIAYFGGLAHMTQVSYFLQNPDYSFSHLEMYIYNRFR